MGESMRRAARSAAVDAQVGLRRERAERARRLDELAVEVGAALRERDTAAAVAERRAGAALSRMCLEGIGLRMAVDWRGSGLTVREATRLRRLDTDMAVALHEPTALVKPSVQAATVAGSRAGVGADD